MVFNIIFVHGIGIRRESLDERVSLIAKGVEKEDGGEHNVTGIYWGDVFVENHTPFKGKTIPTTRYKSNDRVRESDADADARQLLRLFENVEHEPLDSERSDVSNAYVEKLIHQKSQYDHLLSKGLSRKCEINVGVAQSAFNLLLSRYSKIDLDVSQIDHISAILVYLSIFFIDDDAQVALPILDELTKMQREMLPDVDLWSQAKRGLGLGIGMKIIGQRCVRKFMLSQAVEIEDMISYFADRDHKIKTKVLTELEKAFSSSKKNIVIGHSLGGVILADIFRSYENNLAYDIEFVTVGSQVGILIESGRFLSHSEKCVPKSLKKWTNIYSPDDHLSSKIQPVISDAIDVRMRTGWAFPESHSRYFNYDFFFKTILAR